MNKDMRSKDSRKLVSIAETLRLQLVIWWEYPKLKVVGILLWWLCVLVPYYFGASHWHKAEEFFQQSKHMIFLMPMCVGIAIFGLWCAVYELIYYLRPKFLDKFKDNTNQWSRTVDPKWSDLLKTAYIQVLINNLLWSGLFSALGAYTGLSNYRTTEAEIPSLFVYLCQILFFMICEDFALYWSHRSLHHPSIYKHIHKQHHEFYDTECISAEYNHPIEHIMTNIDLTLGPSLMFGRAHLLPMLVFIALRVTEASESHCGYDLPFHISRIFPFGFSSRYHNYHHTHNVGNFGSITIIWDSIFGTNSSFYEDQVRENKTFANYRMQLKNK